jgi:ADP-ribosyl-[dinitrogen reductase] hydrolase
MTPADRFRGSLVGLAIGDALGATNQFLKPGKLTPISDMIGGGTFALLAGQWTDDTSMALCLASSLLESEGFHPRDQLERYVRWWRQGYMSCTKQCYDIGGTTSAALSRFQKTKAEYCGSDRANTAGNGSLVRLAPVVLYFADNPTEALARAADSSRTTHAYPTCLDASRYLAALILGALKGVSKEDLLSPEYEPVKGYWKQNPLGAPMEHLRSGAYKTKSPQDIRGNGYVVNSLEAALWAFANTTSFEDGALRAVNLGEDAISTGALFGQLAGAYYGLPSIPEKWRNRLEQIHYIEQMADRLLEKSKH